MLHTGSSREGLYTDAGSAKIGRMSVELRYTYLDSPMGDLLLARDDQGLKCLSFPRGLVPRAPQPDWQKAVPSEFSGAREQLEAYFAGELTEFDLPLAPEGTAFQHHVWDALLAIPYAETISYGEQARRIGKPKAGQAVGAANGANPIAIVIPCHRVIGANGSLTGFTGGLDKKKYLLAHEETVRPPTTGQLRLF